MNHYDVTPLKERMDKIAEVIRKLNIYDDKLVSYRLNEYKNHDFTQYAMDEFATRGKMIMFRMMSGMKRKKSQKTA
mgnify:CR=1 FL=1